jgi:tRNA pseudouridine65 synthase
LAAGVRGGSSTETQPSSPIPRQALANLDIRCSYAVTRQKFPVRVWQNTAAVPDIELLHVDEHLVVANKPSGMLVHRGWGKDGDIALFRVRDAVGGRVQPLHRLDRGTSGALLFARTAAALSELSRQFEAHSVEKTYLALVRGRPEAAEGTIDYPIPRSEGGARVPAVTHYRVLGRSSVERCALVLARPETGRLHQIRRHLRHLGHPLIGDVNYGSGEINRHYRAEYGLYRLALHASSLAFTHPASGERLRVSAPLPPDFERVLERLGLALEG